jgi:hypothetical protein
MIKMTVNAICQQRQCLLSQNKLIPPPHQLEEENDEKQCAKRADLGNTKKLEDVKQKYQINQKT